MTELVEVVVGRVARAHGIRGDVVVQVRTDEPERRFATGTRLLVDGSLRTLTIKSTKWHGVNLVLGFEGVDDRDTAEALRGSLLVAEVPRDARPSGEEEYYDHQLVGLRVVNHEGADIGEVSSVVHLPEQDLLAVATDSGERLVPFVAELVPIVDLIGGSLRLAHVEGLIDAPDEQ